jgi:hypothetical protein
LIDKILKTTSLLPPYAKKHLQIIIENERELFLFQEYFLNNNNNMMVSIAEFRLWKIKARQYSIRDFEKDFTTNAEQAIERLFLYPHCNTTELLIINPIIQGFYNLEQIYQYHFENPHLNPILIGKKLKQLLKFS